MKILILEDSEDRIELFKRNFEGAQLIFTDKPIEAIGELKKGEFFAIFLDHDLGGNVHAASDENSGYAVAKWLEENPKHKPKYIVLHSLNPAGVANMQKALPEAKVVPFVWTKPICFKENL